MFIDGIDIRPNSIEYDDYLNCVKGLANAVWSINNDFFANIKDSPGRMRVVLLIRPDIFNTLGLQNLNAKVRDNSVLLDWRTTYDEYRSSLLFEVSDRILSIQQEEKLEFGSSWDYYFPFQRHATVRYREFDPSFISMLRFSLYRPRDIVTMLRILQENYNIASGKDNQIHSKDFESPQFKSKYSNYILGEIKDHLSFYYSDKDYEYFLKFFQYLHGNTRFDYDTFSGAFTQMKGFLKKNKIDIPQFYDTQDKFLQFLYELNVICYLEENIYEPHRPFFSWCFRERTPSNIAPKVKTHVNYQIHYGIAGALRLGAPVD